MDKQQIPKPIMLLDKANVEPLIAEKLGAHALAYPLYCFDGLQTIDEETLLNGACLLIAFPVCSSIICRKIEAFLGKNPRIPVILMTEKIRKQQLSRLYNLGLEWQIELTALAAIDLTVLIEQAISKHSVFARLSASNKKYQHYLAALKKGKIKSIYVPETDSGFLEAREQIETDRKLITQLKKSAHYDFLTNIPNRAYFEEILREKIQHARPANEMFHLLIMDVDRFKNVNDSYGHDIGDMLLREIAHRIRKTLRQRDIYARLGGDEYAVILTDSKATQVELSALARRINKALSKPYLINGQEIFSSVSIGIAQFDPALNMSINTLMKHADLALYHAKMRGRNCFEYFAKEISDTQTRYHNIETALQVAIKNHEFYMVYQPIVELETQQICHLEALLRWESSLLKEAVAPNEFIDVAEKSGLIVQVTFLALELVCQYLRHSLDEKREVLPVAINVSMVNLLQKNFVKKLLTTIHNYQLTPSHLHIELTETALMKNIEAVEKTALALRQSGFHLSIDDFGTGYSSLARLREIKFDSIKIDRAFIVSMFTDMNAMQIIHAVLELTKQLGILTIAEGVETEAQFEFLKKWHCRYGQGYYFSKPLLEKDLVAVIDKFNGIERLNTKGLTGKIIRNANEVRALGHDINNQLAGLLGYAEIVLETMQALTDERNVLLAIHTAIVNGFEKCSALSFAVHEVQRLAKEAPSIDLMHKLNDIAVENGKLIFRVIVQLDFSVMPLLNDKRANLSPEIKQKLQRMLELMIKLKVLGDHLIRFSVKWD